MTTFDILHWRQKYLAELDAEAEEPSDLEDDDEGETDGESAEEEESSEEESSEEEEEGEEEEEEEEDEGEGQAEDEEMPKMEEEEGGGQEEEEEADAVERKEAVSASTITRRVRKVRMLANDLAPKLCAQVLMRATKMTKCTALILEQKGMKRFVRARVKRLLTESRRYMLDNQFTTDQWVRWMLQSHVSRSRLVELRKRMVSTRLEVEPEEDDSDDDTTAIRVPRGMHPDFEPPYGPRADFNPSEYALDKGVRAVAGEEAVGATTTGKKGKVLGATLSFKATLLKLMHDAEDAGCLTATGIIPDGCVELADKLRHMVFFSIASDGFSGKGLKVKGKIVRVSAVLLSQVGFCCSPETGSTSSSGTVRSLLS